MTEPIPDGSAGLLRADSVSLPLADDTVDLVVTSPPYFALRSYTDDGEHYAGQIGSEPTPHEFLEALWAVTRECVRVLKPSGSMFVNLGDKYAGSAGGGGYSASSTLAGFSSPNTKGRRMNEERRAPVDFCGIRAKSLMGLPWRYALGCIDDLDLILRAELVWSKPNGLPESVTDRVRRSHEQWFHFVNTPRYYSAVDEVREPHTTDPTQRPTWEQRKAKGEPMRAGLDGAAAVGNVGMAGNPLGKLPGSVWTIPSEPLKVPEWLGVDHFAAFPQEWPRRLILGWSPPDICVECGEGRRPVADVERSVLRRLSTERSHSGANGQAAQGGYRGDVSRTITGYSCACPAPDAPTRPAVVLDPFGGTGTTAMVARALGRYGVSVDLSNDYLRLARWRIFDSGHAAKTIERTNRDRQQTIFGAA